MMRKLNRLEPDDRGCKNVLKQWHNSGTESGLNCPLGACALELTYQHTVQAIGNQQGWL